MPRKKIWVQKSWKDAAILRNHIPVRLDCHLSSKTDGEFEQWLKGFDQRIKILGLITVALLFLKILTVSDFATSQLDFLMWQPHHTSNDIMPCYNAGLSTRKRSCYRKSSFLMFALKKYLVSIDRNISLIQRFLMAFKKMFVQNVWS